MILVIVELIWLCHLCCMVLCSAHLEVTQKNFVCSSAGEMVVANMAPVEGI